jgi:Cu/Ag efflux protein CusF
LLNQEKNLRVFIAALKKSSRPLSLALILMPTVGVSVCSHKAAHPPQTTQTATQPQKVTGPAAAVQTTTYNGVGIVKATDLKRPSIEIDHQEIKGLMPAMTMEFYVTDKSLLQGIKRGDHIEFTIENGVGGEKITSVKRL